MNITARQLLKSDIGKTFEIARFDAETMAELHYAGTLTDFEHITYRSGRLPMTRIHFKGILTGKESRTVVDDNTPITIQEGQ